MQGAPGNARLTDQKKTIVGSKDEVGQGAVPGEPAPSRPAASRSWVTGEFEGVYLGEESRVRDPAASWSASGGREYTVQFVRGRLRNPKRVSAPPAAPEGGTVVRTPGSWPLDIELADGQVVEVQAGETEVHDAVLRLAKGYPAMPWMQAVLGRHESAGIIKGTVYAAEGSHVPPPPRPDPSDVDLARRPGCIGLGPWAWFLLLPLLILLLLLLLALAMGMAMPGAIGAGGAFGGELFLSLLLIVLLIGLALLLAGLYGFSRAIGEAVGEWILPSAFGGLLLLLLLSFLKRCLIAAGFWPLMLLPIFAAVAARRPQAVLGSVVMAALALFANPRGPNNDCLDNDVVETRQRVEQQIERRMNPDRNANVVAIATRGSESGERMSLDQALADPERFFANCGRPIYLSSELLFNVNEAAISERAPAQLEKLAALMGMRPGTRVRLEGYTDATGGTALNRALSERRAQAIAEWLAANTAVRSQSIEIVGRGEAAPIVSDPNLYYLNRRVEISVICADAGSAP